MSTLSYWYSRGYGDTKVIANNKVEGIQSIVKDNTTSAPEYYTIQGIKVANPQPGNLYIVKRGNEVSKVIIR